MFHLTGQDWVRAFICILFIEGAIYFLFPQVMQNFVQRALVDAPVRSFRLFGAALLIIGFVLLTVLR